LKTLSQIISKIIRTDEAASAASFQCYGPLDAQRREPEMQFSESTLQVALNLRDSVIVTLALLAACAILYPALSVATQSMMQMSPLPIGP
jgi:hypothetical protein